MLLKQTSEENVCFEQILSRQTERKTNRQTDRQTGRQQDRQTSIQADRYIQTDGQAGILTKTFVLRH